MRSRTRLVLLAAGLVLGVGAVSGCGSDSEGAASDAKGTVTAAPWAREITTGEQMWTVAQDGWTVTAYDMGRDVAERDSYVADDTTEEPLVKKGDAIVFVSLVATNTSGTTMFVGIDEPGLWAMPMDSPYTRGVAGITPASDVQMADHDVWYHSRMPGAEGSAPFAVAPGESFEMGFVLPLALGDGGEWQFVASLRVYETKETLIGDELLFERQSHTFT